MSGSTRSGVNFGGGNRLHFRGLRLWGVQIVSAAVLAVSGLSSLLGTAHTTEFFARLGFGPWLRYVSGVVELLGAGGLLVPHVAGLTALVLSGSLVGVVAARLFMVGGNPVPAVLLLAAMAIIAWHRPVPSWKRRVSVQGNRRVRGELGRSVLAGMASAAKER